MHAFSVRDLLVEGQSLGLAIGSGLDRVIDTLGEPADRSVIRPLVVKYGSVEFTFVDGVVILIAYYAERQRHAAASAIGEDLPRSIDAITRLLAEHELDVVVEAHFPTTASGLSRWSAVRAPPCCSTAPG